MISNQNIYPCQISQDLSWKVRVDLVETGLEKSGFRIIVGYEASFVPGRLIKIKILAERLGLT